MSHDHSPAPASPDHHAHGRATDHVHHSHVIVSQRVLLTVLGILLFFTLLTVFAAQSEAWLSHRFNFVIPQWVNVFVALSIAIVKSVIVAAYFMQLRYDNPMNTCIAVFTVFVLAFFFGFIMIDMGNRSTLYDWKGREIKVGGTGTVVNLSNSIPEEARKRAAATLEEMMKENERRALAKTALLIPAEYLYHFAEEEMERLHVAKKEIPAYLVTAAALGEAKYGPAHGHGPSTDNTAGQSRPKTGITLAELGAAPAHGGGHGHEGAPGADKHEAPKADKKDNAGHPSGGHPSGGK